jgi:fucose permease
LLGAGSIATALTTSFPLLLASQMVKGFGFGFIDISLNSMATLSFEGNLTESLNNIHGMFGLGALLGPLILAFGLQFFNSLPFAYFVGAILGIAVMILALPQHVPAPSRRVKSGTPVHSTNRAELRKVLLHGLLWLMLLQLSLYVAAELGFSNWIVTIVSKSAGISLVLAAPVATAFYIGLTTGRLGGAQILRRGWLSEKGLLYVATVGGTIAGIIAALFPGQLFAVYIASALVGCFYGPLFPSIMALTNQRFAHAIGLVSSVMMVGTGASSMLLPTAMGALLPVIGINWVIAIPSICCLAIVPPMLLTNRTQRTTLQSSEMRHTMETSTETPGVL